MNWRPERSSVATVLQACGLSLGLAMLVSSPLFADEEDCARSTTRYNAALNRVQSDISRFSACTANSAGRYDCARELSSLKSAGDDYKDAVSDYRSDCE